MEPKIGESEVFLEIPRSFFEKMLYAANTGDLEYLKWAICQDRINLNKKYTYIWYKSGYEEEMEEIENEFNEIAKKYLKSEPKNMEKFLVANIECSHKKRQLERRYKETCPYGSRVDALIRHALETEQMGILKYLTKLNDIDYSKCYQTFYTAMRGNNVGIIEFLLDKGLDMNIKYRGLTVGERVLGVLEDVDDLDPYIRSKIECALLTN